MKLIAKITLSLLLISNLVLTASALTINTNSYHTSVVEADQKDKGGSQGKGGGGGGRESGGGGRESGGSGSRDNMGSRPPERYNPPPKSDNRDGAKEPRVVVREKKKGDNE